MMFQTYGNRNHPAVLFFHAMGVTGESSEPVAKYLQDWYFCIEDHFKYRQAVMKAYPYGHYPVFEGYDHMQYQIRDPKGFAEMLAYIIEHDGMPELPFIRK